MIIFGHFTKKKLGFILIALSIISWAAILIIPLLGLSIPLKTFVITILIVLGEILFWIGSIIVGKKILMKWNPFRKWYIRKKKKMEV